MYFRVVIRYRNLRKATISIEVKPHINIYKWYEWQEDMTDFLIWIAGGSFFRPDSAMPSELSAGTKSHRFKIKDRIFDI